MIFPCVKRANTKIQIHKYINTQIQHMAKCQKELNVGEEPSIFERLLTVCSKLCVASMCKHNPVSEATAGKEFPNFLVLAAVTSEESDK